MRVRAFVHRLEKVNLLEQSFTALVQFEASWLLDDDETARLKKLENERKTEDKDDRLMIDHKRSDQRVGNLFFHGDTEHRYFAPRLNIDNCISKRDDMEAEEWYKLYDERDERDELVRVVICWRYKIKGEFQEVFELGWFPFDEQDLTFTIVSGWALSRADGKRDPKVQLVQNLNPDYKSWVVTENFVQKEEYALRPHLVFHEGLTNEQDSFSGAVYSQLHIRMHVDRHCGYWLLNVVLPMGLLSHAIIVSFQVPPTDLADRCSITLTSLLAMFLFKWSITEKLPDISYATVLDWYVIAGYVFAIGLVGWQTASSMGVYSERNAAARGLAWGANSSAEPSNGSSVPSVPDVLLPPSEVAEVSWELVVVGSFWFGCHVLALGLIMCTRCHRVKRNKHWSQPHRAVFISKLDASLMPRRDLSMKLAADDEADEGNLEARKREAEEQIREAIMGDGNWEGREPSTRVVDVIVWDPEQARSKCNSIAASGRLLLGKRWRSRKKPPEDGERLPENRKLELALRDKNNFNRAELRSFGLPKDLSPRHYIEVQGLNGSRFYQPYGDDEKGVGVDVQNWLEGLRRPFAVVVFEHEKDAAALAADDSKRKGKSKKSLLAGLMAAAPNVRRSLQAQSKVSGSASEKCKGSSGGSSEAPGVPLIDSGRRAVHFRRSSHEQRMSSQQDNWRTEALYVHNAAWPPREVTDDEAGEPREVPIAPFTVDTTVEVLTTPFSVFRSRPPATPAPATAKRRGRSGARFSGAARMVRAIRLGSGANGTAAAGETTPTGGHVGRAHSPGDRGRQHSLGLLESALSSPASPSISKPPLRKRPSENGSQAAERSASPPPVPATNPASASAPRSSDEFRAAQAAKREREKQGQGGTADTKQCGSL